MFNPSNLWITWSTHWFSRCLAFERHSSIYCSLHFLQSLLCVNTRDILLLCKNHFIESTSKIHCLLHPHFSRHCFLPTPWPILRSTCQVSVHVFKIQMSVPSSLKVHVLSLTCFIDHVTGSALPKPQLHKLETQLYPPSRLRSQQLSKTD